MNVRWILFFAVVMVGGCTGQKTPDASGSIRGRIDLKRVLSWLPTDTETLQVANGPFWMSNFVTGGLKGHRQSGHMGSPKKRP
jgi:hypothetical protein